MFGPPLNRDYLGHIERMRRLDNERDEAAYRRDSEHKARCVEAHAYGRRKAELEAERAKEQEVVSDREARLARQIAEVHEAVGLDIGTAWEDVLAAIRGTGKSPASEPDYCGRGGVCAKLDGHGGPCSA